MKKISREEMKELCWTREKKLDYYCNLNGLVTMATNNHKLGSQVCGLSLPPITTCRPDAPCKSTCYACKGHQQFPTVLGTYMKNLRLYYEKPEVFFEQIENYLKYSGYRYCRWFDSGDIVDEMFLQKMIQLANDLPNVHFMAFTKKYELVNSALFNGIRLPKNLNIVFSAWTKDWVVDNPFNLPVAYVNFKNKTLNPDIPKNAYDCTNHCSTCFKCWFLKKGESTQFNQH